VKRSSHERFIGRHHSRQGMGLLSEPALRNAAEHRPSRINPIIFAEVSMKFDASRRRRGARGLRSRAPARMKLVFS